MSYLEKMNTILLLTWSYWAGHNAATQAIKNTVEEKYPNYKCEIIDILDFLYDIPGKFTKNYYEDFCSKYPIFWEKTFNIFDDEIIKRIVYGFKNPLLTQKKFEQEVERIQPSSIIIFFPFWLWPLKYYIKKIKKKFTTATVITDAINIHSLWHIPKSYIDHFFLIDQISKDNFEKKFNRKKNVHISFFPIEEEFFVDKKYIDNKNITILLTSLNREFVDELLEKLSLLEWKNITILKWREDKNFEELKSRFKKNKNLNFKKFINLKKSLSKKEIDLMITKPWGALCSECIATDTPIIAPDFVPWQEEGNKKLLELSETWIYEKDINKILFHIKYTDWNKFLPNFRKIKNKKSCEFILNKIL